LDTTDTQPIVPADGTMPLALDSTVRVDAPVASVSSVLPQELSERYTIRRVIGRGSFGIVFLAEDRRLGRLVAIKQLFAGSDKDPEQKERFIQEARIAGQLEHPNVIIVYNIEGTDEAACIIMEFLGGGSLLDVLKREGQLPLRAAGRVMLGILSGLQAAHGMMVVHRDIKPQNILFGVGAAPKISDFGIAHLPASAGGSEVLEQSDQAMESIMGTPLYMSPEQVMKRDLDGRSDLYSAGVIFYQMLAGRPPIARHRGMTMDEIAEEILTATPESIRKFRPECPRRLEDVAMCLLEKARDNRFPQASEVAMALLKALQKVPAKELDPEEIAMPLMYGVGNSPGTIYADIISLLLIDGVISPAERAELEVRAERLGLSPKQARSVERRVREERGLPEDE